MVGSNERGRALEYRVTLEIENFLRNGLKIDVLSSDKAKSLNFRDKLYFDGLDEASKIDFSKCAATVVKWLSGRDWMQNPASATIHRFGDDNAKNADPTDLQLGITNSNSQLVVKNFSMKHKHDALKHPRLPSLAQQCGIAKGTTEDVEYRARYTKIWSGFGKKVSELSKKIQTFEQLGEVDSGFKAKHLYVPLMKNAVEFLSAHSKSIPSARALFEYLVGRTDYIVIKNEPKFIELKDFSGAKKPVEYFVVYPYKEGGNDPRLYFLLEFSNRWKIRVRIHNASSRIFENGGVFVTEKMDPICINKEEVIKSEIIQKP